MTKDNVFLNLLRKTFPDSEIPDYEELFTNEFMDSDFNLPFAEHEEQLRSIKALAENLNKALKAYGDLHAEVQRVLERQFTKNSNERQAFAMGTTIIVHRGEMELPLSLGNVLKASLYSLTGRWPIEDSMKPTLPIQESAIASASQAVRKLADKDYRAKAARTPEKYGLVKNAIRLWKRYSKEPLEIRKKPFLDFLNALTGLLDHEGEKGWDALALVRSYERTAKRLKSRQTAADTS